MKTCLLLALYFFVFQNPSFGQSRRIANPVKDFIANIKSDTTIERTIHRIIGDFNGDGRNDIALSESGSWGNAGGLLAFYFKRADGYYRYYDNIETFHPEAYSIRIQKGKPAVLMVYMRENCCAGSIGYFQVGQKKFKLLRTRQFGGTKSSNGEMVWQEVAKELSKGRTGHWTSADITCLATAAKDCWTK